MRLYELKQGQKFRLSNTDTVLIFHKVDGMYAIVFTEDGERGYIACYVEVGLL